jgi:hypothetical protein
MKLMGLAGEDIYINGNAPDAYELLFWTLEMRQVMQEESREMILRYRDLYQDLLRLADQAEHNGQWRSNDLDDAEMFWLTNCMNFCVERLRL